MAPDYTKLRTRLALPVVCCVLFADLIQAEEPAAAFSVRMRSEQIFVGEMPSLIFTIRAPKEKAVDIVKRRAFTRVVTVEVQNTGGKRTPPQFTTPADWGEPALDYSTLEAGKTVELDCPSGRHQRA